jgi:dTDP-4-amino-4,6-dideoxygalactose transaminase
MGMKNEKMIPFNIPYFSEKSNLELQRVIESRHYRGDGKSSTNCNELISSLTGGGKSLLTPSCTAALEMTSLLVDLQPGDEVILPSFTFTSAALAIVNYGATPVFVDIDPKYKNIDVNQVLDAVTPRTKAISVVNYAGVGCDFNSLREICIQNDLYLIEDNAHGLGAKLDGVPLGSFGDFATQSFHETKNLQCGEGGALIVNDPKFFERAEIIREKGTDRSKFTRGEVNKYQWVDKGSSYLLSEVLAGILLGQLQEFELIQKRRRQIWEYYASELTGWTEKSNVTMMEVPPESEQSFHMFYCETQTPEQRTEILAKLLDEEILAVFHYQSLHSSAAGKRFGRSSMELINSDKASNTLFRLPLYYGLQDSALEKIVETIKSLKLG